MLRILYYNGDEENKIARDLESFENRHCNLGKDRGASLIPLVRSWNRH